MNWRETYKNKIVTAEEAVSHIRSGDKIISQQTHMCAQALVDALVARADELHDVGIFSSVGVGREDFLKPEYFTSFKYNCIFLGPNSRDAFAEHRCTLVPCHYHQLPRYLTEVYQPNVLFVTLSVPDENGMSSFSLNTDYTKCCVDICDTVIAQINVNAPRSYGNEISLDQVTWIVEADTPLVEVPMGRISSLEQTIGSYIAPLIPDGACLQLGIGGIPDAVLSLLHHKKDLGVHTELFSDGVVDLYREGVINNSRKQIDVGKIVTNTVLGTKKTFDFVNNNPNVLILPVDYTNDPYIIARNDNVISINACLEVDLFGQVVADTRNKHGYSGIGGQVDFVRGATASKGGKSFIALPSTASGGKVSRIVCAIEGGNPVTTSRYDVQYLVTEFGIARLWGLNTRERAEAIIDLAHPDFQEQLRREAFQLGVLY
jgi:4-hydroxybutyrate CoA-transferase